MPTLYTIGHSNRQARELLALLQAHGITKVIDVRTIPRSRKMPWFNKDALKSYLKQHKISYLHLPALGGLRRPRADSPNQGWHNSSFRGFADYMQTKEFFTGLKTLNCKLKKRQRVAIMCAEAVPWRCHRSMIADAEVVRGIKVKHIMSQTALREHVLIPFAKVDKRKRPIKITYPHD